MFLEMIIKKIFLRMNYEIVNVLSNLIWFMFGFKVFLFSSRLGIILFLFIYK